MATDSTATPQSAPTDATLIAAARRGETASFRVLVGRHQDAGARLARRLAPAAPAELLSDAIAAINVGLRSGAGPRTAFRTHLLTVVHRTATESRKGSRNRREEANNTVLGIDPALLAVATRAYRALPESQQVALWHTEVDGDPLLDTGGLLGVSGTEIAELAFAGREVLRHALLESHLEKIAAGPCRWTTDRMGAFLRARLNPANTEKVATHLKTCSVCFTALPAVRLVETELQPLVATIVLGPAAAPYLGREVPRQVRRRPVAVGVMAAAPAFLISHGKAAAFVGLGAALVTGGLISGTNLMASDDTPTAAVGGTFNIAQAQSQSPASQSQTQSVPAIVIADSGSGVAGGPGPAGGSGGVDSSAATDGQRQSAVDSDTADAAATPTAPRPLVRTEGPTPKVPHSTSQAGTPAASSNGSARHGSNGPSGGKSDQSDAPTLHLGFTDIAITPGSGFLWLFSFSHTR